MPFALSVNLNKIALIRNSRPGNSPDVLAHGDLCLAAGADGLTVHPRPDQRHIRPDDVRRLAQLIGTRPGIEFNVEGNPFGEKPGDFPGFLELVAETSPHQCTLVPDSNDQLTSDHGFDLTTSGKRLEPVIRQLRDRGIRVSLFMDPDPAQISLARDIGADRIELYTGPYAAACKRHTPEDLFQDYCRAAAHATRIGLGVNAGHDLNLDNMPKFAALPGLLEVSIGHALIIDALDMGLKSAVQAYKKLCG